MTTSWANHMIIMMMAFCLMSVENNVRIKHQTRKHAQTVHIRRCQFQAFSLQFKAFFTLILCVLIHFCCYLSFCVSVKHISDSPHKRKLIFISLFMEMVIFQTNSNIELTHLWVFRTETLNKHLRLTRTLNWITLAKYRCCLSANIQTHVLKNTRC